MDAVSSVVLFGILAMRIQRRGKEGRGDEERIMRLMRRWRTVDLGQRRCGEVRECEWGKRETDREGGGTQTEHKEMFLNHCASLSGSRH